MFPFLDRHRFSIQAGLDSLAWGVALVFGVLVRYDFQLSVLTEFSGWIAAIPLAVLAQVVAGLVAGLYVSRWRFGSFEEVAALVRTVVYATIGLFVLNLWVGDPQLVPRGAVVIGGVTAVVIMAAFRYAWRLAIEARNRPSGAARLLVFGAGEAGEQVVTAMLRDPRSPYLPVAILDDDPAKHGLRIRGVRVVGTRAHLERSVEGYDAEAVLIAIPSAGAELVAELTAKGEALGLPVKVLPPVAELLGAPPRLEDIRDVTEADLLGRRQIRLDLDAIAGYLTDKRVLVTGAGGSIGSELCRQIHQFGPAELLMLDRDESALHAVQLSIEGRALHDASNLALVDVRDTAALRALMWQRRPHVVFHAAALKHVPLLESHPAEALRTNVWATLDLLEISAETGVERFVNVSTDKAADPTSVLGYTKRISERLTTAQAIGSEGVYLSVRFGNVLGSRGSMLETFQHQVAAGGPITVTDPETTRYFMTVEEAVQLTIQAGAVGRSGEALVLDMGERVRILDVAQRLARQVEPHVEIVFTGLRAGEKLHETLFGDGETDRRPVHPMVSHVDVPPLGPLPVRELDPSAPPAEIVAALRALCTTVSEEQPLGDRG